MGVNVTIDQLQSICLTAKGRQSCLVYLADLNEHMPAYGIDTPQRVAMFLAQLAHESGDFTRVVENLSYGAQGLADNWPGRYAVEPKAKVKVPNALATRLSRNPEAIANNCYANRMGNGTEASGDGWRYRGRGLKQLTGAFNYGACGTGIGAPLLKTPELLEQPRYAVLSACWFWREKRLNAFADSHDLAGATQIINGGLTGLPKRVDYWGRARAALA